MRLEHADFTFTLLTPCFSGTALGKQADQAEMRIPPIRGHVRFWHRALFGLDDCNQVWGSAAGKQGHGSRVSVSFVGSVPNAQAQPWPAVLPHKLHPKERGQRPALAAGQSFTIRLQRLPGCTHEDWEHAQRAVKLWLLLGCLGLRANRAAGSVWPIADWAPRTAEDLKATLRTLGLRNWTIALIGEKQRKSPDALRETASDTIKNPDSKIFGGIKPRKPSPVKFKVIQLGQEFCLLACAPDRRTLQQAEEILVSKQNWKDLGTWNYVYP